METRSSHLVAALRGAITDGDGDAATRAACEVLCSRGDEATLEVVAGVLTGSASPGRSVLEEVAAESAHPAIRGVVAGVELLSLPLREAVAEAERRGRQGPASSVVSAHQILVQESRSQVEIEAALVGAALRAGHLDVESAAEISREARSGSQVELWTGVLVVEDTSEDHFVTRSLLLGAHEDTRTQSVLLCASQRVGWEGEVLDHDAAVLAWRRGVVDEICAEVLVCVQAGVRGEPLTQRAREVVAAHADAEHALEPAVLARWARSAQVSGEAHSDALIHAVASSVLAALGAGRASAAESAAVLAALGVQVSSWTLRERAEHLVEVSERTRAQALAVGWECGSCSGSQASDVLRASREDSEGDPEEIDSVVSVRERLGRAVASGEGDAVAEVLGEIVTLSVAAHAGLDEDVEEIDSVVCAALLDTRIAWSQREALLPRCNAYTLDTHLSDLEVSAAGDETFVELAVACPYVCESHELAQRRDPESCARAILARLCAPGVTHAGMSLVQEELRRWRGYAITNCAAVVELSEEEVCALPWERDDSGHEVDTRVGRHLRQQLGADLRAWQVLEGLSPQHEGSVGELCEVVRACLAESDEVTPTPRDGVSAQRGCARASGARTLAETRRAREGNL